MYTLFNIKKLATFRKGRKKGSRNKMRKSTTYANDNQRYREEEHQIRKSRNTRQTVDTGLRASRELRGYIHLLRAFR